MYAFDNADKIAGLGRQLRSIARDSRLDPEDLVSTFAVLRADLDHAEGMAVATLRAQGHSWADIGSGLGMTRQAAHKRFGHLTSPVLDDRGQVAALGGYVPANR